MTKILHVILLISIILLNSCNKDEELESSDVIETSYVKVSNVFNDNVMFGGKLKNITNDLTDYGFVFGINSSPTFENDSVVSLGKPKYEGDFFQIAHGFIPGNMYYARAFTKTSNKTYYGKDIEFNITLIDSIYPEGAGRLDTITLYGTNFANDLEFNKVKLNSSYLEVVSVANKIWGSEIRAIIPYEIGIGEKSLYLEINNIDSKYSKRFKVDPYIKIDGIPGIKQDITITFEINGLLFFGTSSNNYYSYNYINNEWKSIANFPGGFRSEATVFSSEKKAYVGLGRNPNTSTFLNDFYEYNPETNSWSPLAEFPDSGLIESSSFFINNEGYVLLGKNELGISKKNVLKYNPELNTWVQLEDFPSDHWMVSSNDAFVLNNSAYVLLSLYYNSSGDLIDYNARFYYYTDQDDSWSLHSNQCPVYYSGGKHLILQSKFYSFFHLMAYDIFDGTSWTHDYFNHRSEIVNFSVSDSEFAIIGTDSKNMWIFKPE